MSSLMLSCLVCRISEILLRTQACFSSGCFSLCSSVSNARTTNTKNDICSASATVLDLHWSAKSHLQTHYVRWWERPLVFHVTLSPRSSSWNREESLQSTLLISRVGDSYYTEDLMSESPSLFTASQPSPLKLVLQGSQLLPTTNLNILLRQ